MSTKIKKITLTKILTGSSLLLSTLGLPLVLTSCSKKSDTPGHDGPDKPDPHGAKYLFKVQPKFFNDKKNDVTEASLVTESKAKGFLDESKGYNKEFFKKLDATFENKEFFKENKEATNENEKYENITSSFGEFVTYYLNIDNIDKKINFEINDEMLSKCSSIKDVKKYIEFDFVDKQKLKKGGNADGGEEETRLVVQNDEKGKENLLTFYGKELKDGKDVDVKIDKNDKVKDIKKATIDFSNKTFVDSLKNNGLCGLIIKLNPIEGDDEKKAKTIVVKFVKNDEFKFFNQEIYNSCENDMNTIVNDYYFVIKQVGDKEFNDFVSEDLIAGNRLDILPNKEDICDILKQDEKKIDEFAKYLEEKFSLKMDVKKSLLKHAICLVPPFDKEIKMVKPSYLLCLGGKESKINEYNVDDIVVSYYDVNIRRYS